MAIISGPGGIDLEAELAAVGVQFVHAPGDDAPAEVLEAHLNADERQVRAVVVAEPPAEGEEFAGMGAWHINAQHEVHFARTGRGLVQFQLPEGVASVEVMPGDVMIVHGAEHRYRPIEAQEWILRHTGPAGADMGASNTGRADDPWPEIS